MIRIASYLAASHLRAGRLVQVLASYQGEPEPLSLVYPQHRHLLSAVRAFADWLGELYRAREPGWQPVAWAAEPGEPGARAPAPSDMAP